MKPGLAELGERARDEGLDIGFVSMGFAPDVGGIETHLAQLAREFLGRGHRVHVLCIDARSENPPYSSRDEICAGVRVRRVAYRYHDQLALADLAVRRAADDAVMAWLAEEPCDIVHVHHASAFGAGLLQAIHEMGRPLCLTLHDYWLLCPRGQMLRHDGVVCEEVVASACAACLSATWPHLMPSRQGEKRGPRGEAVLTDVEAANARSAHSLEMLALPARLFAPSNSAREVYERAGVPPGRIEVLPNGVDTHDLFENVEAARRATARDDAKLRVGILGSAQPSKGVLEFAREALALPDAALAIEVHGALGDYHGDRSYAESLRRLAAADARLELHGEYAHDDLARILARLDLVCVPSLWNEVFGLSAREARAAGLFVFASDRGGLADLRDDPAVRLLPAGDPAAWQNALAEFLRLPAAQRAPQPAANLRGVHALALELERHYVDLVRTQLGREPGLCFELGSDRATAQAACVENVKPSHRRWWQRFF